MNLTKAEQRLLKQAAKTERWAYKSPVTWSIYLIPFIFVAGELWLIRKIAQMTTYRLCVEVDGALLPLDVSLMSLAAVGIVLAGAALLLSAWLIVKLWKERRVFHGIIKRLESSGDPTERK